MLRIIGGAYRERCLEPDRDDLYGSGLRAATALSDLTSVELFTYVDDDYRETLQAACRVARIVLKPHATSRTLAFRYHHPLAAPTIIPSPSALQALAPIEVSGPCILRFGMLEGAGKVDGDRVVYDPQSPISPQSFAANGSQARELAIVTNRHEAFLLTGEQDPSRMAAALFAQEHACVVVIKRGTHGALVFTNGKSEVIPAYKTEHVQKIGSGDVFAAAFAKHWAVDRIDPIEAARCASAAAAMYCGRRTLPLPLDYIARATSAWKPIHSVPPAEPPLVYLAGPFFTMAERWLISESRAALSGQGVRVFSPLHEVGHGPAGVVVPADLEALGRSAAVFAILDGLDSGTLFEVGWATARGIPCVAFVQNEHVETLKMLHGTDCLVVDDFTSAIYHAVWAALRV